MTFLQHLVKKIEIHANLIANLLPTDSVKRTIVIGAYLALEQFVKRRATPTMSRPWTSKPHFCGGGALYKGFSQGTLGALCALLLASCGQSVPAGYPGSSESSTQSGTLQPLTAPPNPENRPPVPGTTGQEKTADGLPALHVMGNNTALFSERMRDETDRLDRLENAVQELRNDFDAMSPAIVRLVAIEGDIQNLIQQLEGLTGDAMPSADVPPIEEAALDAPIDAADDDVPVLPPIATDGSIPPQNILPDEAAMSNDAALPPLSQPAPIAQERAAMPNGSPYPAGEPTAPADSAQAPSAAAAVATTPAPAPAMASGVNVMDIRIGEHPGKTRIVLDVSGKSSFTADLDNQERILVIEIPAAGWNAALQQTLSSSPLLSSYRVERLDNGGSMLILQLKKAAVISYKGTMDDATTKGQRLIIDLTAQ